MVGNNHSSHGMSEAITAVEGRKQSRSRGVGVGRTTLRHSVGWPGTRRVEGGGGVVRGHEEGPAEVCLACLGTARGLWAAVAERRQGGGAVAREVRGQGQITWGHVRALPFYLSDMGEEWQID